MPEEKNNAISVQVDDLGTLAELKAMQEAAIGASEAVDDESHSQEVAKHRVYSDSKYEAEVHRHERRNRLCAERKHHHAECREKAW